jgi:hypothetical protein
LVEGGALDVIVVVAVMAIPLAILGFLLFLYRRWAERHDPMGGRARDGLPMDAESKRPDVYHD